MCNALIHRKHQNLEPIVSVYNQIISGLPETVRKRWNPPARVASLAGSSAKQNDPEKRNALASKVERNPSHICTHNRIGGRKKSGG